MTAAAFDNNIDAGYFGEKASLTDANITLVEVGNIVIAVDLVDAVEASFLDHRFGTARTLLSRLKENPDRLIAWDTVQPVLEDLYYASDG